MAGKVLNQIMLENGIDPSLEVENVKGRRIKTFSQLSEKKKKFVELICNGVNITDAIIRAGYYVGKNTEDKGIRRKAYQLGYEFMKEPVVRDFIALNMKHPVDNGGKIDEATIIDRLMLITMGQVEVKTTYKGKEYYSPPAFRDQVSAAKVLMEIKKMQDKKVPTEKRVSIMTKRVDAMIDSLDSSYQLEQIVDDYEEVDTQKAEKQTPEQEN